MQETQKLLICSSPPLQRSPRQYYTGKQSILPNPWVSKITDPVVVWLMELNKRGSTIALVTHDATVAAQAKRIIHMQDGVVVEAVKSL